MSGGAPQLALDLRWDRACELDSYVATDAGAVLAAVRAAAAGAGPPVLLYGAPGSGKSHLLQAACSEAHGGGRAAVYLRLAEARAAMAPEVLEGFEGLGLVALDQWEAVAGERAWEEALLHCFNRCRESGATLLMAARRRPADLGLLLPDLASRLQWGLVLRLAPLDDPGRRRALALRAQRRGLDLPRETLDYLLTRESRDPAHLFGLLDRLDRASLAAGRRLTVPFVREVLARTQP